MEGFFHFASVAGQLFPRLDDRRRQLGYVGRIAWADAARRLSCLQEASGVHRGIHSPLWAERVNFVRDVASSDVLEEFETYRGGFVH